MTSYSNLLGVLFGMCHCSLLRTMSEGLARLPDRSFQLHRLLLGLTPRLVSTVHFGD